MSNTRTNMPWDATQIKIKNPLRGIGVLLVILAILFVITGFKQMMFTIDQDSVGLVLRFGHLDREVGPGLHFKAPYGIEDVEEIAVQSQKKEEFGFRTLKSGVRTQYDKQGFEAESIMLTGDLNSVDVQWVVQYRITDPYKYLFKVRNVNETFRDINEATMREIIGDRSVDEVITWGKEEINREALKRLQEKCDQYETGVTIQVVLLQNVNVPPPVQPSWNEVNAAEQERDKLINQARAMYNTEVPKAKGEAERSIKEAEGYAIERVNHALGVSGKFNQVYEEYAKAPEVTRRRIYLETMAEVIPKAGRKIIVDSEEKGLLQFLDVGAAGGGQ